MATGLSAGPPSENFDSNPSNAADPGVQPINIADEAPTSTDPFAAHREAGNDPFAGQRENDGLGDLGTSPSSPPTDRRMSKEWDASKVPPSRFQKREGSIFATPGSRDAHTGKGKDRDQSFKDKLKEKGWL